MQRSLWRPTEKKKAKPSKLMQKPQVFLAEALRNYNYWNRRVFKTSGKIQVISSKKPKQKVKEKPGLLEQLIALRESRKRMKDGNNL